MRWIVLAARTLVAVGLTACATPYRFTSYTPTRCVNHYGRRVPLVYCERQMCREGIRMWCAVLAADAAGAAAKRLSAPTAPSK